MEKICKRCGKKFETNNKHRGRCDSCMNNNIIMEQNPTQIPKQQIVEGSREYWEEYYKNTTNSDNFKAGKIGWYERERDILKTMFKGGKSYDEIAKVINNYRRDKTKKGNHILIPHRSARSVVFQAQKIGLITDEELKEWDKQHNLKNQKERQQNYYKIKKKVLDRDNNKCIYCGSTKSLEFAHIIPFYNSRKNEEKETITLCHKHHKKFDGCGDEFIVKKIFKKMCSYYPDYFENYEVYNHHCPSCGDHCGIRKIKKI